MEAAAAGSGWPAEVIFGGQSLQPRSPPQALVVRPATAVSLAKLRFLPSSVRLSQVENLHFRPHSLPSSPNVRPPDGCTGPATSPRTPPPSLSEQLLDVVNEPPQAVKKRLMAASVWRVEPTAFPISESSFAVNIPDGRLGV